MKYKNWQIFDTMPEGFVLDNTAGSPLHGHVFITNGKSVLNNQVRALLKINKTEDSKDKLMTDVCFISSESISPEVVLEDIPFPTKPMNDLARLQLKERILKDILADLLICEIEGWDKKEYINDLQNFINSIKL